MGFRMYLYIYIYICIPKHPFIFIIVVNACFFRIFWCTWWGTVSGFSDAHKKRGRDCYPDRFGRKTDGNKTPGVKLHTSQKGVRENLKKTVGTRRGKAKEKNRRAAPHAPSTGGRGANALVEESWIRSACFKSEE